ncbi:UNVERIFIED_CONTAM: hypothetical protein NCL1_27671 [Trichonephila clavipes]
MPRLKKRRTACFHSQSKLHVKEKSLSITKSIPGFHIKRDVLVEGKSSTKVLCRVMTLPTPSQRFNKTESRLGTVVETVATVSMQIAAKKPKMAADILIHQIGYTGFLKLFCVFNQPSDLGLFILLIRSTVFYVFIFISK